MGRIESAFALPDSLSEQSPTVNEFASPMGAESSSEGSQQRPDSPSIEVGNVGQSMTAAELEVAIDRAQKAVVSALIRWHLESCFAAAGDADRAVLAMERLQAMRSPEAVARLERERKAG